MLPIIQDDSCLTNHPVSGAHNLSVKGPRRLKFGYGLHEGQKLPVTIINVACDYHQCCLCGLVGMVHSNKQTLSDNSMLSASFQLQFNSCNACA